LIKNVGTPIFGEHHLVTNSTSYFIIHAPNAKDVKRLTKIHGSKTNGHDFVIYFEV
jgi:hypothetical protein